MIGSLSGLLMLRDDPHVLIEISGVGYKVLASHGVLSHLPKEGEKVTVFTYTHVREDALELYGFAAYADLKLFESLLSVSGIGPKTALGVFSLGSSREIANAIIDGNVEFFSKVPRLGKKNAQKIIIELTSKLGGKGDIDLSEKDKKDNQEVIAALRTFGYSSREAEEAISQIVDKEIKTEEKIRLALKYLGK